MDQLKYDSLYSGLVSINKSLGGTQSMPDSEYGAMIDLMETLSGQPVGESGDAYNAVSTVATMAENGELPIQGGGGPSGCKLGDQSIIVNSNGTYRWDAASLGWDGFSSFQVDVNVPTEGGGCKLGSEYTTVNSNGNYRWDAVSFGLDGLSSFQVDVNVSEDNRAWWYDSRMTFAQSSITSIPSWFEPDRVTYGYKFFDGVTDLSTVGDLVFGNIYNAEFMFNQVLSLTTIGSLTINYNGCDVYGMFTQCENLSSIGSLNITPIDCRYIFQGCRKLQSVPLFDTSSATYITGMFNDCKSLTTIPLFNFSSAEEATYLFAYCDLLKTIPQVDFSKLQNANAMFADCTALESLPELDFGKVRSMNIFSGWSTYPNLTTIGGFRNLKASGRNFIGKCPNLTVESLMNIINNLWDWSGSSSGVITFEDGTEYDYGTDHSLSFGETNLAKLTDEQKAVATNKGWQLN